MADQETFDKGRRWIMITTDSTGGTSHGSGNPPVFDFQSFLAWLLDSGIRCSSYELARYLYECVGFQRLVPYFNLQGIIGPDPRIRNLEFVHDLFSFDDEMRSLLLDGIGIVETQLKSQFNQILLKVGGPYCLYAPSLFRNEKERRACMSAIELEVRRHVRNNAGARRAAFGSQERIPVWVAMDVASLGTVRRMYANTRNAEVVHRVADSFNTNHRCLHSWLRTLTLVRNCCAHFNPYVVRPQIPAVPKPVYGVEGDNAKPMYAISLVDRLLRGRADTVGGLAMRDYELFREEASNLIGAFAWRYPPLVVSLGLPGEFVDEYAESRLPHISFERGEGMLAYRLVSLAA